MKVSKESNVSLQSPVKHFVTDPIRHGSIPIAAPKPLPHASMSSSSSIVSTAAPVTTSAAGSLTPVSSAFLFGQNLFSLTGDPVVRQIPLSGVTAASHPIQVESEMGGSTEKFLIFLHVIVFGHWSKSLGKSSDRPAPWSLIVDGFRFG